MIFVTTQTNNQSMNDEKSNFVGFIYYLVNI